MIHERDRQTDRRTGTACRHIPRLCIASHGKNHGCKRTYFRPTSSLLLACLSSRKNSHVLTCAGDSDFCSGRTTGLYGIAGNCTVYYQCVEGETFVQQCPRDLIFSIRRKQCLPLFRVPERADECVTSRRY